MSLIVETGEVVASAESYVTASELAAYALKRGESLPADTAGQEQLLIKAMDYLEGRENEFQGTRVTAEQVLSWPRMGVVLNGFEAASYEIPQALKNVQMQLAIEAHQTSLTTNSDGREVLAEEVPGVIKTTYAESGKPDKQPRFEKVETLLKPLKRKMSLRITR